MESNIVGNIMGMTLIVAVTASVTVAIVVLVLLTKRSCPHCRTMMPKKAVACPHCGKETLQTI
jgi:hypothetical protein